MDIRHPLQRIGHTIVRIIAINVHLAVHILLNKADKLSNKRCVHKTRKRLKLLLTEYNNSVTFQFSLL